MHYEGWGLVRNYGLTKHAGRYTRKVPARQLNSLQLLPSGCCLSAKVQVAIPTEEQLPFDSFVTIDFSSEFHKNILCVKNHK
jgi:hypothetical protein